MFPAQAASQLWPRPCEPPTILEGAKEPRHHQPASKCSTFNRGMWMDALQRRGAEGGRGPERPVIDHAMQAAGRPLVPILYTARVACS